MADRETARRTPPPSRLLNRGLEPSIFEARGTSTIRRRHGDLHICPSCSSHLVYPTDWAPGAHGHWHVALRCPECEWNGGGRYAQDVVDRLDEVLDEGTEAMLEDLNVLVRANMEEQVERFAAALEHDVILPEDF